MATTAPAARPTTRDARPASRDLDYRPSYLAATIVTAVVFALYLLTLAPSTAMWDTSEYITAAYTLGLPHPPGNPLFVLIGRVFAVLPIPASVAVRINILAALSSAVSAGMWFLITERVLVSWFPERWQRVLGGTLAALIGATAFTVWNQSVVNEKVYTVSLMGIAIISWLMIRWSDEPDGRPADRILVLVAYLLGLGYANHMGGMLAAPAAALAVLVRRPRTIVRWRLLLACVAALVFGITPFATQPIRAAHFPALNEGEPTACRVELTAKCTFSKATYDAFMYNFNRGQYGKPDLAERQAPFTAQLGMWWYYFKWQWLRDAHGQNPGLQSVLAAVFLVLGLFGGWVHWRRDRQSFWYFGSLMFTMTLVLIYYLNFKYGNTQSPELQGVEREVRDRDYFFLWSFSAWGVWAALGLVYLWETLAALIGAERIQLGREVVEVPRRRSLMATAPVLALALIPLITNASTASRAGETDTRDFAHDLLNSVEPYGVLVTVGDNDTFPLWYAQEVEGIRKDVVVANTSLLNTDWYVRQLIRRPVYDYDEAKGPALYRGGNWKKPSGPPLKMTLDQADSVPAYTVLTRPMVFRKGEITATIDPRYLIQAGEGAGLLQRADIFVLYMLRDAFPERPMYFSRTSGGYAQQLGLENYTLTQGLASKVFVPPPAPGRDTLYLQGDGWLDVRRTEALWKNVFLGPQALIEKGDWIDRPSVGIPYLYVATGLALAEALRATGRPQESQQVLDRARLVAGAVRLEQLLANVEQGMQVPAFPSGDSGGRQLPVQTP
ncbi:MAG: DUF2723 domain-containing protein [Gemmatimonadota bacterium]|nr:DUF2723 domain-containing protein [Gemmatimonadota bacterium]